MDAAAREVMPVARRAARRARRAGAATGRRRCALLERLLGLEMKMRQYEEGKRFCDAVVAAAGVAAMHGAWRSPEDAPTIEELRDPSLWLARQGLRAA